MRRLMLLLAGLILFACNAKNDYPKAENALDAGREFLDGLLKGNSEKAAAYMVDEPENRKLLMKLHRQFKSISEEDQQELKTSSIIIDGVDEITENEVIIQYRSSYDRQGRKIKVVNNKGVWLVDLKYTINPNL